MILGPRPMPIEIARVRCGNCGAPEQPEGAPCHYCAVEAREGAPARHRPIERGRARMGFG